MKMSSGSNVAHSLHFFIALAPRFSALLLAFLVPLAALHAQSNYATPYTFVTLAGSGGSSSSLNGTGLAASFLSPSSVAVDNSGNVYVADAGNNLIRKITPAGVVTTLAGSAGVVGSADGTGTAASFNFTQSDPQAIAVDSSGNVYLPDARNHLIRKITAAGVVTTLAGSAGVTGSADGTGSAATFTYPLGIAVDSSGNVYVADSANCTIRKITPAGIVTTLAGSAGVWGNADGTGSTARFKFPMGVAVDGSGNLYVADAYNSAIRKITPGAVVTTLAGGPNAGGSVDGTGTAAQFWMPRSITVDGSGNVYVADTFFYPNPIFNSSSITSTIRKISPAGAVSTLAGGVWGNADGTGTAAKFLGAQGLGSDSSGNIYVADTGNNTIRKITTSAVVTTFAGGAGGPGNGDGAGGVARFAGPQGVAVDSSGNVYVADFGNVSLRKLTPAGSVSTMPTGYAYVAPQYRGVAVDASGIIYLADAGNNGIRKINPDGTTGNLAGYNNSGSNDGPNYFSSFNQPFGVAVDATGNVYVADSANHTIRKISGGTVSTLAGQAGSLGSLDGTGNLARFNYPQGLTLDGSGNIYVADTRNSTIRKITPAGVVSTLAGLAGATGSADGTGSTARFNNPQSLTVDASGNIYVSDGSHTIRQITPAGVVTTLAGQVGYADFANGTGSAAHLVQPTGIAMSSAGYLFVADAGYNSVLVGSIDSTPAITSQPASQSVIETQSVTFTVVTTGGYLTYQWRKNGVNIPGAISSRLTFSSVSVSDAGSYDVVATNYLGSVTTASAVLSVAPIPVITSISPARQVLVPGQTLNLSVTATGTGTLTYQWYHNGNALAGATASSRSIPGVTLADAGWYQVFITDNNGTRHSTPLFVTEMPAVTQVRAWGFNASGQTNIPPDLSDAIAIAEGNGHSLVLRSDGTVVAWGNNVSGQTTVPTDLTGVVAVSAGTSHSLALKSDGTVIAWGDNYFGQSAVPTGLAGVVAISAGNGHSLALKSDGTVAAWGANYYGQCRVPVESTGAIAIAAGASNSLALKADGTVVAWGDNSYAQSAVPSGLLNVSRIAAGNNHALALMGNGTVIAWGDNSSGQTNVPMGQSGIVDIAAGASHSLALKGDGTVIGWGDNSSGEISPPSDLANVLAISAGGVTSLAIRDGTGDTLPVMTTQPTNQTVTESQGVTFSVVATGPNPLSYQWQKNGVNIADATSPTLTLSNILPTDAGNYTAVVSAYLGSTTSNIATLTVHPLPVIGSLSATRQVLNPGQSLNLSVTATGTGSLSYQWIHNGKLLAGANTNAISVASVASSTDSGWYVVLITDSIGVRRSTPIFVTIVPPVTQVVGWGDNSSGQTAIPAGLTNVTAIAAGYGHALALKSGGTVVAWGNNGLGQTAIPAGLTNVTAIAAGYGHSMALKSDGTVAIWGNNGSILATIPTGLNNVVAIAAGDYFALALKSDGTVVAWGDNTYGTKTVPAGLSNVVAITAAGYCAMALKSDGTIVTWGNNSSGQGTVPTGLSNVAAIATGDYFALAVKRDGTVIAWGDNYYGEQTIPAGLSNVVAIGAGSNHALALKSDGTVVAWGSNDSGQATPPANFGNGLAVSGGYKFSLALRDGTSDAPPSLSIPASQTVIETQLAVFSVTATGAGPFSYQWRKGGVMIAGATASTFTIPKALPSDTGNYDVVVTNYLGSTTSAVATLTVNPIPVVTSLSPTRQVLNPGQSLNLSATATGTGPLSYQWIHNGKFLAGANANSFSVASVASSPDSGWYVVLITDNVGTRRSPPIFITIAPLVTQVVAWGDSYSGKTTVPGGLTDAISLAAGSDHVLALKRDGTVVAWGDNSYGQISVPSGLTGVVGIVAGGNHSMALKSDGTVVAWGAFFGYQQLFTPGNLSDVVAVADTGSLSMALKSDGTVVEWDGTGTTTIPTGFSGAIAIAAGNSRLYGLKNDGTALAWSNGAVVQDGPFAGRSDLVAIAGSGGQVAALTNAGTVLEWGLYYNGVANVPAGVTGIVAIATGEDHTLALKSNGTVIGWGGYNAFGQATVPANLADVIAIFAGRNFSLALRNGSNDTTPIISVSPVGQTVVEAQTAIFTVIAGGAGPLSYQWRKNGTGIAGATSATLTLANLTLADAGNYDVVVSNYLGSTTSAVATLSVTPIPAITSLSPTRQVLAPGQNLNLSVSATGTGSLSYQWIKNGRSISGAVGPSLSVTSITAQYSGWYQVDITDNHGTRHSPPIFVIVAPTITQVIGWGNGSGQIYFPTSLNDVVALAADDGPSLGLRSNGTVVALGGVYSTISTLPGGLSGVVAVAVGSYHALALKSDGTIVAWGYNIYGETNVPAGLAQVVSVAAGDEYSLALKSDGTVVWWGWNRNNQYVLPLGLSNVVAIAAGGGHSLALKYDGTVVGWGVNGSGQVTIPSGLNNVVAIAARANYSLALKGDGTVVAWGDNGHGQTNVPSGLNNVVAIAAGYTHSLALRSDGTVVAWGDNTYAEATPPANLADGFSVSAGNGFSFVIRDPSADTIPVIVTPPASHTVVEGQSVVFSVAAASDAPLSYQWQKNGVDIAGATSVTFTIANVIPSNSGDYSAVVTNYLGSVTSNPATLTVNATVAPTITTQPVNQTVTAGASASFTAAASGTPTPTLQWQRLPAGSGTWTNVTNGSSYAGATTGTLTVSSTTAGMNGDQFRCVATNSVSSVTSSAATLTVNVAPAIVTQPVNQSVTAGASASFTAAASGSPTPAYQWQRLPAGSGLWANVSNGGSYAGVTTGTLTVNSATAGMSGDQFRCVANNSVNSAVSNPATLTVNVAPVFTAQPANQTVTASASATFTAAASGSPTPTYLWQRLPAGSVTWTNISNGGSYAGATTGTLTVSGTTSDMNGDQFRCVATNSVSVATSTAATLTVNAAPAITTQPVNQTVVAGAAATFTAAASGSPIPTYQWQRLPAGNVTWTNLSTSGNYAGTATGTLTVSSSTSGMSGDQFRCVATNSVGSATSNAATLTVNSAPVITTQPVDQTVAIGASLTFTAAASGTPAPTYQWQRLPAGSGTWANLSNGGSYAGATTGALTISGTTTGMNGDQFRCVATNSVNSTVSNIATLAVLAMLPPSNAIITITVQ